MKSAKVLVEELQMGVFGMGVIKICFNLIPKYINIYTNIYKIYRYVQNTRRRPGGGGLARPRGAGPGPARDFLIFC